jgi:hypothetical protein
MKMKWKILIVILAFALILTGFLVSSKLGNLSKPVNPTGDNSGETGETGETGKIGETGEGGETGVSGETGESMPVLTALPIFYSNSTVNSNEEALAIFNQHFDATKESTIEKLSQYGKSPEAEIINEMVLFSDCATVERREWKNDQYWLGPDKSAYVIVIPAASKYETWSKNEGKVLVERVSYKGEAPQNITLLPTNVTTYENMKNYLNETYPGEIETYWTETKLWIKYLIDDNGTIYWAGEYLKTQPWLD